MTRRDRRGPLLVVVAAVLAYGPALDDYFVQDDFGVVWLLAQRSLADLPRWFVSSWMENIWGYIPDEIRPFPALTFLPASLFGAEWPLPHHAITLGFHVAVGLLVLYAGRTLVGLGRAAAAFAAVLFVLLPNGAETAGWITGRVDSMPALFYLASFACFVRWRSLTAPQHPPSLSTQGDERAAHSEAHANDTGAAAARSRRLYAWAVIWCFVALFTKQTAITLVASLVLYDVVVGRRRPRLSLAWLRPYLPFILLTAGYLLLRYVVFADVVREGLLTSDRLGMFLADTGRHLTRIMAGQESFAPVAARLAVASAIALLGLWAVTWRQRPAHGDMRWLLFFAAIWIPVALAPTVVAGYVSPRHAYQASIGWALALGVLADGALRSRNRTAQRLTGVAMSLAIAVCALQLRASVVEWERRSTISKQAVADIQREARRHPPGTLILAGVSPRSWNFSLPFALQPPFTDDDIPSRMFVVGPSRLYCCPDFQWNSDTRRALEEWSSAPVQRPVVAMRWDPDTGALKRLTDDQDRTLRTLVMLLLQTPDRASLDNNLLRILDEFVALHAQAVAGS